MKKLFSIVLLVVFLFNLGGYYIVFWGIQYQTNKNISAQLALNQYSEDETVLLKIPMNLPYPVSETGFKNVEGNIEHNNQFYKLVKQKIEDDTLYIVCYKDTQSKNISNSMIRYANESSDLPSQSKQSHKMFGKLLKEYGSFHQLEVTGTSGWSIDISFYQKTFNLVSFIHTIQAPPPKA